MGINGIFPIHQSAFASDDLSKVFCETSLVEISTWGVAQHRRVLKEPIFNHVSCVKKGKNDICILHIHPQLLHPKIVLCLGVFLLIQFNFWSPLSIPRISDLVDILWHLRLLAFFSSSGCFSWLFLRQGIMTSTSTLKPLISFHHKSPPSPRKTPICWLPYK